MFFIFHIIGNSIITPNKRKLLPHECPHRIPHGLIKTRRTRLLLQIIQILGIKRAQRRSRITILMIIISHANTDKIRLT